MTAEDLRNRTKSLAIEVILETRNYKYSDEIRILTQQIIRSATSVASNYRAVCRARSDKEFYAKLCIVVEECDETLLWLELFRETQNINREQIESLHKQYEELTKIFAKSKLTLGSRLKNIKQQT